MTDALKRANELIADWQEAVGAQDSRQERQSTEEMMRYAVPAIADDLEKALAEIEGLRAEVADQTAQRMKTLEWAGTLKDRLSQAERDKAQMREGLGHIGEFHASLERMVAQERREMSASHPGGPNWRRHKDKADTLEAEAKRLGALLSLVPPASDPAAAQRPRVLALFCEVCGNQAQRVSRWVPGAPLACDDCKPVADGKDRVGRTSIAAQRGADVAEQPLEGGAEKARESKPEWLAELDRLAVAIETGGEAAATVDGGLYAELVSLYGLRRVVLEGKGQAQVPKEVAIELSADCGPCRYDSAELAGSVKDGRWFCWRKHHSYPVIGSDWIRAIDAAGAEILSAHVRCPNCAGVQPETCAAHRDAKTERP